MQFQNSLRYTAQNVAVAGSVEQSCGYGTGPSIEEFLAKKVAGHADNNIDDEG